MKGVVFAVNIGREYGVSSRFSTLGGLVSVLLANAYYLAGFLILVFLIFAGINIIMGAGSGDKQKIEKGRKTATMAVAGFVVIFLSWFIIKIIEIVTGVNILSPGF